MNSAYNDFNNNNFKQFLPVIGRDQEENKIQNPDRKMDYFGISTESIICIDYLQQFTSTGFDKDYCPERLGNKTYPFKPSKLQFGENIYILNKILDCEVKFDEGNYTISNSEFDITAWGETRTEAEEAFAFVFDSLYKNFALESDDKLSQQAKQLKDKILVIVNSVDYED